jgi:hypothetical protein
MAMTTRQIMGLAIILISAYLLINSAQELYQIYQAQSQLNAINNIWGDVAPKFIEGFGIDSAIKDQKNYHSIVGIVSLICLLIGIALTSSSTSDNIE